jgi:DNA-binding MarR family transcriptional regulator
MAEDQIFLSRLFVKSYRIIKAMNSAYLANLGYHNFKIGHIMVLMNLDPNGSMTVDLAKKAKISKQAMSILVKELTAEGYLTARNHPNDLRASLLFSTEKGEAFIAAIKESRETVDANFAQIIGHGRLDLLKEMLTEIVDQYEEHLPFNDSILSSKL